MTEPSKELAGLMNLAETIVKDYPRTTRDQQRARLARQKRKPLIYRERGEWLVLERTAPGEWWLSSFDWPS